MSDVEEREQPTLQEQPRAHPRPSPLHSVVSDATGEEDSRTREHAEIIKAGLAAVKEWEAENGAFTEEEIAWANEVLDRGQRHYENLEDR